jgi:hypothetical protein
MSRTVFARALGVLTAIALTAAAAGAQQQQGAGRAASRSASALATKAPAVAPRDTNRADAADKARPPIMREVFTYDGIGRRDPFYPLIMTSELRPLLGELTLTSIIVDPTGRRSVAVMRDKNDKTQYRVTTGMLLGRMRVIDIRPKAVYFTIQEFGSDRRDSLLLVDTTKVRSR